MPLYQYRAVTAKGTPIVGRRVTRDQRTLVKELEEEGQVVTEIREVSTLELFFSQAKRQELILLTRHLGTMLRAGLPLTEGLRDLVSQAANSKIRFSLQRVLEHVLKGKSLSEALAASPELFPRLYCHMVRSGEATGRLDETLLQISKLYEDEEAFIGKIRQALTYPALLVLVSIVIIFFIVTNFVPKFVGIFQDMGIPLPWPTRLLLFASTVLPKMLLVGLPVILFLLFALVAFLKTEAGQIRRDFLKLRLPLFGPLIAKINLARFLRTLSLLYGSGVSILESLELATETLSNAYLQQKLRPVGQVLSSGEELAPLLKATHQFNPMVLRMVATGEKTGELSEMLENGAAFYETECDATIQKISVLLEPILLLVMGGIIVLVMLSTLLPMFDLIKTLRK